MSELTVEWEHHYHHTSGQMVLLRVYDDAAAGVVLWDDYYMGGVDWCTVGAAIGDALGREEALNEHLTWCVFDYVQEWGGCECQCHDEGMWIEVLPVVGTVTEVDAPVYGRNYKMKMCQGCVTREHNMKGF